MRDTVSAFTRPRLMAHFPAQPLTQLLGSNGPVHALTYSAGPSTYILTGSADRNIRLYNPARTPTATGAPPTQLIQTYAAHGYEVLALTVSPDNSTFASAGGDRAVFLWDVATALTIRRFGGPNGHSSRINSVSFAGEAASLLVSGSFDASVRIWDVKSGNVKPIMVLSEAGDSVSCVLAGDGEIWAGSVDGRVRKYDLRCGKVVTDVIGSPVTSLKKTKDGRGLLVGSLDNQIRLMDAETGGLLKSYRAEGWKNDQFRMRSCFGARERWVMCGNEEVEGPDGQVIVWDTLSGEVAAKVLVPGAAAATTKRVGPDGVMKLRKNVISCVAWKGDGKGDQWCCGGADGAVTVFGSP